ncbi:MAG: ABC transporter ATP-binding protein [Clostridia bacterium]|nr:ABC transporter ATP-binding protein [Clostridia bacterium]
MRTLLGLITPTSGSAQIFGKDIQKNKTELLGQIGYLPSETAFYSGMKVKDLLSFAAKMRGVDCKEEAKVLCERLELNPERTIDQLSLGNRKKVGIVCALQHAPALYILDEPTGGLDPLMQREFYKILKERNEQGATVFLSSHNLFEVSRYCKHAAVIREGRILALDSVEKLGHTGVKRVSLRGTGQAPTLPGMRDVKVEAEGVRFLYDGDVHLLLQALASISFEDLTLTDPELDEIFMHYYEKGDTLQ